MSLDADMTDEECVVEVARLVDAAIVEVAAAVRLRLDDGAMPRPRAQPELNYANNGMARLSDGSPFSPKGLFQWSALLDPPHDALPEVRQLGRYPADTFPAVDAFRTFVTRHADRLPPMQGIREPLLNIYATIEIDYLVDGIFHRFDGRIPTSGERATLLRPWLVPYRSKVLPLALVVPVALVRFEVDRYRLGPNALLIRMSDALQRARWEGKAWGGKGHDSVLSAATHAFVLTGWQIPNSGGFELSAELAAKGEASQAAIARLFAALRLITGIETGYAQEIRLARGWRLHQTPGWPQIYAAPARHYPDSFDDFGWMRETVPLVTRDQLAEVAAVYRIMARDLHPRLTLALGRLNTAMTRENPADGLLDAVIALEILLGDQNTEAVAWKLRMRAAAITGRSAPPEAVRETLAAVKAVYAARSAIVHGAAGRGKKVNPSDARGRAVDLLRGLMLALLREPKFLDPEKIDEDLLLGTDVGETSGDETFA